MGKSNDKNDIKEPLTNCSRLATLGNEPIFRIKKTEYFSRWHEQLRDTRARMKIHFRITQTELGNFGDFKFVGDGIYEMRIHYGPGYRIYYTKENNVVVLLLVGGDKTTQQRDIEKAKELKNEQK